MSDPWEPRIRREAERLTDKRMGRERRDEAEDDEAWDMEYGQALEDLAYQKAEREIEARAETKRIRRHG